MTPTNIVQGERRLNSGTANKSFQHFLNDCSSQCSLSILPQPIFDFIPIVFKPYSLSPSPHSLPVLHPQDPYADYPYHSVHPVVVHQVLCWHSDIPRVVP